MSKTIVFLVLAALAVSGFAWATVQTLHAAPAVRQEPDPWRVIVDRPNGNVCYVWERRAHFGGYASGDIPAVAISCVPMHEVRR